MKKYSSILAVIMVVITLLISKFPNKNGLVFVDATKGILGLAFGILSVVFMILSIFFTKNNFKANYDTEINKIKFIKIAVLIGIFVAIIFMEIYVYYIWK